MPLDPKKIDAICDCLQRLANGQPPRLLEIGELTMVQFEAINELRAEKQLPALESRVLVYNGKHHFDSRYTTDGYAIEHMVDQLISGLCAEASVVPTKKMTGLQNKQGRMDHNGVLVKDLVLLELTTKKPRALVFSVIPKGDGK